MNKAHAWLPLLLLFSLSRIGSLGAVPADVPDRNAARVAVDAVLQGFSRTGHLTLGAIVEVLDESIEFGAPAYNAGDIKGCYRFYQRSTRDLISMSRRIKPSEEAAKALEALRLADERVKKKTTASGRAWTLRFAFDITMLRYDSELRRGEGITALGDQYFRRSQYAEAERAFRLSVAILRELAPLEPTRAPAAIRLAPLALGHALFAQKKFIPAARSIQEGLVFVPDWPKRAIQHARLLRLAPRVRCAAQTA